MSLDAAIRQHRVAVNGVELDVMEAGDPANPTVLLCHGFPESAYSWRHQLPVLAAAGYHAIAPDQRGYGGSSAPKEVEAYGILQLTGDLCALLDHYGKDDAVWVGHDWGAFIVWDGAKLHPDRVRAVVGASVPAVQWPAPPVQMFRMVFQDNFFYILYFQDVGPAETELERDTFDTITKVYWGASAGGFEIPTEMHKADGTGFLTRSATPPPLPWSWFTEEDAKHYAAQFDRSGFFGPVSYYRNLDANYEVVKDITLEQLTMPSFFISGAQDLVLVMDGTGLERMKTSLPNYFGAVLIDGVGHWTQQEKPAEFNDALLGFLRQLDG